MKKSMVIAETPGGPLLGGLDWRPSLHGRHSTRALKALAVDHHCTHYSLCKSNDTVLYGLYGGQLARPPRDAVAAAACFANLVGGSNPNAALVLPVEALPGEAGVMSAPAPVSAAQEQDNAEGATPVDSPRFLVVVLEEGAPLVDAVLSEASVRETIGSATRPMWAFCDLQYPGCEVVDHRWLAEGRTASARLQRVPRNPWPAVVLIGLAVIAFAVSWGYRNVVAMPGGPLSSLGPAAPRHASPY